MFVALPVPPAVRAVLIELKTDDATLRWTPDDQLHITLRFLGDVPHEQIGDVTQRLRTIRVESFILPLEGVGAFPTKGPPRVLWASVGNGHPRLFQLRQRLDDTLLALGLNLDVRLFHPHVTLARCPEGSEGAAAAWVKAHRDFAGPSYHVDAFELYASERHAFGAVHTLIDRFPLSAAPRSLPSAL